MDNVIQPLIRAIAEGRALNRDDARRAFQVVMNGGATPAQMAALMVGMRLRGETVDEITAGAECLRAKAATFSAPPGTIDTCGTGGDARGTLNISTATAFVLAGAGVPVAKHGNRAVSSSSGSADVLSALGIKIDAEQTLMERSLREANICFLFAPKYHTAMRHIAPVRQELGIRSVFNLLGPLSNPARPDLQLLGVYSEQWLEPLSHVLHNLGVKRAWVVHGRDGLDELSIAGPTRVAELHDGYVRTFDVTPQDAGLTPAPLEAIRGGDSLFNAAALSAILKSEKNAYRDAVVLNAAAALVVAGKANDLRDASAIAAHSIDEGKALRALHLFMSISNERP